MTDDLVYRNAKGEPLDADFNVDEHVLEQIRSPWGHPFHTLRTLKERDSRAWVSPEVSFQMLCNLEDRLAEIEKKLR